MCHRGVQGTACDGAQQEVKQVGCLNVHWLGYLENIVVGGTARELLGIYGWWIVVQTWRALAGSPQSTLPQTHQCRRQLPLGTPHQIQDKEFGQPVTMDGGRCERRLDWSHIGWDFRSLHIPHATDYLMLVPTNSLQNSRRMKVRYDAGYAVQSLVVVSLKTNTEPIFNISHAAARLASRTKASGARLSLERDLCGTRRIP